MRHGEAAAPGRRERAKADKRARILAKVLAKRPPTAR